MKTPAATRNFDVLGGVIFTISMVFLLVGLTTKGLTNATTHALNDWTEPTVGGFILIGVIGTLLFIWAESRAKEPIVPLDLWKGRTYSATMVTVFFAAFAFFGAIVFLPRWFQVVEDFSPTNSGLALLPLMIGLIGSSVISGYLVSRTGHYKWIIVGSIAIMGVAVLLMTQLTKDTPVPVVWLWMFIAGLGVGTTFSVPTIVIQNAVPFKELGVATSNLTFFRQIGGTIALAFVGTIFATSFQNNLAPQMTAAGVPPEVLQGFAQSGGGFDLGQLTGVGDLSQDPGRALAARGAGRHPEHHPGHLRGVQPRHRPGVLARGVRFGRRIRRRTRDQGDPAAEHERGPRPGPGGRTVGRSGDWPWPPGNRCRRSRRRGFDHGSAHGLTLRSS